MQKLDKAYRKDNRTYYNYLCDCGNKVIRRADSTAKSCREIGCTISSQIYHGKSNTRLYKIWCGIRDRCIYNHKSKIHYKDKDIKIDPLWNTFPFAD